MWKFDERIAEIYSSHVLSHIPNYSTVLDLSCDIANDLLTTDAFICDFGSANGNTLKKLYDRNFKNLYGVEINQAMIDKSTLDKFKISSTLPDIKFDYVIANWSLHFNQNKEEILESIFDNLKDNGLFLLSEKVSLDSYTIKKYHQWKRSQGVSDLEIKQKEEALVGAMFIDSAQWYLETLNKIGFKNIEIVNSHWCFCTFFCRK
jgi:tRNA (cmo5U34)-methyltransferase